MSEASGTDLAKALRESVEKAREQAKARKAQGMRPGVDGRPAESRQTRISGLREQLIGRVKECAPRSLQHFAAHDLARFGIEAGVAVELAAKAILVDVNPCLIADPKHFPSMLALSGQA